jgi:scyllo-inositol 2-dehydrogenase (NADP+)
MIKAGIIGFGKSGKKLHAPLLDACKDIKLTCVVSMSSPVQIPGRENLQVLRTPEELFSRKDIDLVIITTPNHLHASQAEAAIKSGKHVVVEKPFTVSFSEAKSLIELSEAKGTVLSVFQNRRLDGDFITVKKLIAKHAVGQLVEFESRFDRFRNFLKEDAWKEKDLPGSGILYDLSPHLIDQAIQLFGKPKKLFADIRNQRQGDADDWFEIRLYYHGFTATLKAGMLVSDKTPRFVLRGMNGSYTKYGFDPQEESLANGDDPHQPGWGHEPEEKFGILRISKGDRISEMRVPTAAGGYPAFYSNIADAIKGISELMVQPSESAEVVRLIELAQKSSHDGQIVTC